jgi:AcrR family transcriptional regulator
VERRARLTRAEQVERNRELVLEAAMEVFVERGYVAATLDQIAERAGFSRGVVYSQFADKSDLFLTVIEWRRDRRIVDNRLLADQMEGTESWGLFVRAMVQRGRSEPGWNQVLLEFRTIASRDPELNERYERLHADTITELAAILGRLYERAGIEPPEPLDRLASTLFAIANGMTLEQLAQRGSVPDEVFVRAIGRALGFPTTSVESLARSRT